MAVTGSAGFLGANLIGVLEDSPRVTRILSLDQTRPDSAREKTEHYPIDLTDRKIEQQLTDVLTAERIDTLVHLAFHDSPTHHPDRSHYLESVGTMYVAGACRRAKVRKLILTSHTFLYGANPKNPSLITEDRALYADPSEPFFRDKLQAERDALEFGRPGRGRVVTILRTAPILGPGIDGFATRYLTQERIPNILGFDPLWQFLHESDAVLALKRAVDADAPGVFNVAGEGVIPLSKVIRLMGARSLPMTRTMTHFTLGALWVLRRSPIPASFTDYLQYPCIGDTEKSRRLLGFIPMFSSQEAILDFAARQNMRQVELLSETPAA